MQTTRCAFHPNETIVNFCRSPGCFLPLCPTCVKIHSDEHRQESTYGQFQNINTVVGEIDYNINSLEKLLVSMTGDFMEIQESKKRVEGDLRKNISEAKAKIILQVERYFQDIESALFKSITHYNEVVLEDLASVDKEILELRRQLRFNSESLNSEKSLKTVITYYLDDHIGVWKNNIKRIQSRMSSIRDQSGLIVIDDNIITQVMEKLDQYMTINYEGYQQKGYYAKEYSKAKMGSTSRVGTINND